MRSEVRVEESMGAGVFIGVGEREFISEWILLQKARRVSNTDIQVCPGKQSGTIEIGAWHYKQIGGRARCRRRLISAAGSLCGNRARLNLNQNARNQAPEQDCFRNHSLASATGSGYDTSVEVLSIRCNLNNRLV